MRGGHSYFEDEQQNPNKPMIDRMNEDILRRALEHERKQQEELIAKITKAVIAEFERRYELKPKKNNLAD